MKWIVLWMLPGLVVSWLTGRWLIGILLSLAVVSGGVAWWWFLIRRSLRKGLGPGQTVSTAYTDWGEWTVTDVTGTVSLARGSAAMVSRTRDRVMIWSRTASFVLPTELVTDEDIAFLEGHGDAPTFLGAPGPVLPLSLEVTPQVQGRVTAAAARVRTTSADTLFPFVPPALLLPIGVVAESLFYLALAGVFLLIGVANYLQTRRAARIACRAQYPVGMTIRAQVTQEHLVLQARQGTIHVRWSEYIARRLTRDAVLLRRDRRRAQTTLVLPRDLFTDDALAEIARSVPREY
ncbi:hypothetical protein LQK93_01946 [Terrabacter sp. BE26]